MDWSLFRKHCSEAADRYDFLDAISECAQAATVHCCAPPDTPASDLSLLSLRASWRRTERRAIRTGKAERWTEYRRVDACCRRQARRTSNQIWRTSRQSFLAVAISLGISEEALAELLADRFAPPVPQSAAILTVGHHPAQVPTCLQSLHPAWTSSQVTALFQEALALHELQVALRRGKRRSAPGVDGVTPQMLRNLAASEQQRLLECFNEIWQSGQVPEAWRTAIVAPILKDRKPTGELSSY
ncbi:uncharacterized protein [Dermacentor albipictus]|uniref:uncharacterized protein n=1 Tax=Dermacentor albipictus TaxID=60249 RepID=UPI0038FCA82B